MSLQRITAERVILGLMVALSLALAAFSYDRMGGQESPLLYELKRSWTTERAMVLLSNPPVAETPPAAETAPPPPAEVREQARKALAWDYPFLLGYVFFLWAVLRLIGLRREFTTPDDGVPRASPRWFGLRIEYLPILAGVSDAIENRGLAEILQRGIPEAERGGTYIFLSTEDLSWFAGWWPMVVCALNLAKWFFAFAAIVTIVVLLLPPLRKLCEKWGWLQRPHLKDEADGIEFDTVLGLEEKAIEEFDESFDRRRAVALAFSGGGIRSATFNLGILQALADRHLLRRIHYLSTVSGGGYIGAWLSQWLHHEGMREGRDAEVPPVEVVEEGLAPDHPTQEESEAEQITHLRNYSNYLTPRMGLLSADTWATIATYGRNFLLNLLIIVSLVGFFLLLPRGVGDWLSHFQWVVRGTTLEGAWIFDHVWAVGAGFLAATLGVVGIGVNLAAASSLTGGSVTDLTDPAQLSWVSQGSVQRRVILPLVVASVFSAFWLWATSGDRSLVVWVVATAAGYAGAWAFAVLIGRVQDATEGLPLAPSTWKGLGALGLGAAGFVAFVLWRYGDPDASREESFALWVVLSTAVFSMAWVVPNLVRWYWHRGKRQVTQTISQLRFGETPPESEPVDSGWRRLGLWFITTAAAVGAIGGWVLERMSVWMSEWSLWELVAFGPPVLMVLFVLVAVVQIGFMGRSLDDDLREWFARVGGWICIYTLGWLALGGLSLFGPVVLAKAGPAVRGALTSGWLATSVAGALAGNAREQGSTNKLLRPFLALAPWVFIIGLVVGLSWGLDAVLSRDNPNAWQRFSTANERLVEATVLYSEDDLEIKAGREVAGPTLGELSALHEKVLAHQRERGEFWIWIVVLALVSWAFSRRVGVNEFSMHHYYRNRLVRAFLGATNPDRRANPFTGFDPSDDGALGVRMSRESPPLQPFHLVNAALNLVAGSRLAWQERKAASYIFSPLFSGYELPADREEAQKSAFRPTDPKSAVPIEGYEVPSAAEQQHKRNVTRGTAMAISGAAASPNMGFRSSPALSLLLTVFNVRLGWWLGNPGTEEHWGRPEPPNALRALVSELFGLTKSDSNYVYLSDGGHFENLGIYELVRRRCRYIIACDAGADAALEFQDLGNAIRKCRTDFGVEIQIDVDTLLQKEGRHSRRHCAVGKIRYPRTKTSDPATGYLLYIKPTLTGDEPEDVQQYAKSHETFPHESTADQFFDESQFESYRRLGEHIGGRVLTAASSRFRGRWAGWETLFAELRERWFAPSAAVATSFSRHGETLDRLWQRLSADRDLDFLDFEMHPQWIDLVRQIRGSSGIPKSMRKLRSAFYVCSSLIQLMENVYLDLQLDREHNHPDNRGWVNLFRQWVDSPMMKTTWALSAGTYGARFQTFCKRRLRLEQGSVEIVRMPPNRDRLDAIAQEWDAVGQEVKALMAASQVGNRRSEFVWHELQLKTKEPNLSLPVGFCLTEEVQGAPAALLYFQIDRHLRVTGLAQRGLLQLRKSQPDLVLPSDSERLKQIPPSVWNAFEELFYGAEPPS